MMREISRLSLTVCNIYLIFSLSIIQVVTADRPLRIERSNSSTDENKTSSESKSSVISERQLSLENEDSEINVDQRRNLGKLQVQSFRPSISLSSGYGDKIRTQDGLNGIRGNRRVDILERDQSGTKYTQSIHRGNPGLRIPEPSNNIISLDYDVDDYSSQYQPSQGYDRAPFQYNVRGVQDYFEVLKPNQTPHRTRFNLVQRQDPGSRFPQRQDSGSRFPQRQDNNVRFPAERPQPSPASDKNGGLLGTVLGLLRPQNRPQSSAPVEDLSEPSYEFIYNNIDDTEKLSKPVQGGTFLPTLEDYEDYNINLAGDETAELNTEVYDFKDVLHSIRNNETRIEILKKFLSATTTLTNRAGTDPSFMLFNMPITILSILGGFYALSAIAVIAYKYILYSTGNANGAALAILPVAISFFIPAVIASIFLVVKLSVDGQINLGRLARGDFENILRQDFDGLDFLYDAAVGSTAILGLGWIVSVIL
ncbi:uncharacterized protein LOC111714919 [Eurytemora carolleeae]|uniref:uncharacterized protein LOC111714919 n=1 Tax=Eurytemora carolleeae TaxID=1294199 RepID=UPI000C77F3D0|nr:uncharacterized protein LOC111714919 [Eurytemora carolleeae]|eukprot:XP_023345921.1 uncharacterized protein LOC111714919 [Eurytemora affinis]